MLRTALKEAILTDDQYKEPSSLELCGEGREWEQGLLATQATRFLKDRIGFVAGKPCSYNPSAAEVFRIHVPFSPLLWYKMRRFPGMTP
ncbi:hypothetical protein [Pseudomonas viciae]|uniref:Uncharacterized protein n=1 Tax=Pseudomonas viciae TaxID=2505979 RepID=A0A4P7PCJ2_9PSED|nr:hypothetical protein [Pseudomonas viciae]QBZ88227.1 hypothetical protein EPZ47_05755 [Pseudomonas viciae]UZE87590.1 hypothetical protein LOY66_05720 [Pseudomonas viciae]